MTASRISTVGGDARPGLFLAVLLGVAAGISAEEAVIHWAPKNISSPMFESHPAFDPLNGDLYFVRSSPDFSGWRIFVSHPTGTGWSVAETPAFAGDGVESDPCFSSDGRSRYFISNRSTDGIHRLDLDL